ncbi:MAG TPA: hypothetical protein VLE20_15920 [Blastocatellia bacterium]|nr:hypothetical protein [Blastocatellia bacterium]
MQIAEQAQKEMSRLESTLRPVTSRLARIRLAKAGGVLCLICVLAIASEAAQDLPPPPIPVDPTPLVDLLSVVEKSQLDEARRRQKEVEFYVKIGETHLDMARSSIKNGDHQTSERELDIYNKAMKEAMKAAVAQSNRQRSLAKKIEQNLYRQIKTLEAVELMFPIDRQQFATAALKLAKQLRVQALNAAFASGETLKDPEEEEGEEEKRKSGPPDGAASEEQLQATQSIHVIDWRFGGYKTRMLPAAYSARGKRFGSLQTRGDYLTEEEGDKVREAQEVDSRAKVFMKIADRRIKLITGVVPPFEKSAGKKGEKKAEEEEREWGVLKATSRTELLKHYARAIEECMAKIEDAYERNPKSKELPKALATLREATDRHLQTLRSLAGQVTDEGERRALSDAIEEAELANKGAREGIKSS